MDTKPTTAVTKQQIINMMVGRVIYEQPKSKSSVAPDATVVLRVNKLNATVCRHIDALGRAGVAHAAGPQ